MAGHDRYQPPADLATGDSVYQRYQGIIDDWEAFCRTLEQPLRPCLRPNTARISGGELARLLREEGADPQPVPWHEEAVTVSRAFRPGRHWGAIAGLYQIQEGASLLPVQLMAPQRGERVLDLCAAPGNKTVQLAEALGYRGTVVANDANRGRLAALRQAIKRFGVINVSQTVRDGQGMPWAVGRFDKVLVDAPCSCEGTFRKTATAAQRVSCEFRDRLARKQRRILRRAMALTRPGGTVVYATCTLAPEENEAIVANALQRFGGAFELCPARLPGLYLEPGLEAWEGERYGPQMAHCGRLWPHHNDTGGFFVAVLRRVSGGSYAPDPEPPAGDDRARQLLQGYHEELGVPLSVLEGLTPFFHGRKYVKVLASDHRGAGDVPVDNAGIPAVRAQAPAPKPATAGAMALGPYAARTSATRRPRASSGGSPCSRGRSVIRACRMAATSCCAAEALSSAWACGRARRWLASSPRPGPRQPLARAERQPRPGGPKAAPQG